MKKLGVMLFVALGSANSFAARYMVKFNEDSTLRAVSFQAKQSQQKAMFSSSFLAVPTMPQAQVLNVVAKATKTLASLSMMEVELDSRADAQKLAANPEVAYIEEEYFFAEPAAPVTPIEDKGEITWGLQAVNAEEAWAAGHTGEGARVLVIDTGVDKNHPDIRDNFEEGKSFIHRPNESMILPAASFGLLGNPLFDAIDKAQEEAGINDYKYYDDVGHGTHVSGTIASPLNGFGVAGVAPDAKLLAAKVCSRLGCSSFAIIAGLDYAIEKKVDVVNMSLGGPVPSRSQLDANERVEAAGITVVAASGNDGENVKDRISYPAGYPTVFSVGALTPELRRAGFSQYGPNLDITAPGTEVVSPVPEGTGRESVVKIHVAGETRQVKSTSFVGSEDNEEPVRATFVHGGLGKATDFADAEKFAGKIALIQRGEITFKLKVENALAAGVAGVVIYNNTDGLISGSISPDGSSIGVPVAMIEKIVGDAIAKSLAANETVGTSISVARTDYAPFAGTSMASPHVAGVAALVTAARPDLSPAEVRDVLRQSAINLNIPTQDNEYGAGMVNAASAASLAVEKSTKTVLAL